MCKSRIRIWFVLIHVNKWFFVYDLTFIVGIRIIRV